MVVIVNNPASHVLGGGEGENLPVLAQEDGGAIDVGAHGVHAFALDGDFHGVDASFGPGGDVVGVGGIAGGFGVFFGGGAGFFARGGCSGDGVRSGADALRVQLGVIHDSYGLVEGVDHCFPVGQHGAADAGPFRQPVVAGVVLVAAVDVAQDGVGSEEDLRVASPSNFRKGAGQLEAACDGGDIFVAGASGEVGRQADDVVGVLLFGHDAVIPARLECGPLGVVGEVVVGVVLEVDQQGLGAVEH